MLENTRLGKQFRNMMKVFGVAIAVYLALTIKIGFIGEVDEVNKFDYLKMDEYYVEEFEDDDEMQEEHGVTSVFQRLCIKYNKICKKVTWVGDLTEEEKSLKLIYVIYLLSSLDNNIIYKDIYPSNALIAMLINEKTGARRGSANRNTVTINLGGMEYDNEFFQVISHEMGHIVDLGGLQGTSKKKNQIFTEFNKAVFAIDDPSLEYYKYSRSSETVRKNGMTKEDFCSGYGMSDPFEDFAECHNLYLNHHDYFRKLAMNNLTVKDKYNFMSNLYGGKYINDSEARYENWSNSYRVWDTTKIREG